jgi:hypothetical protein
MNHSELVRVANWNKRTPLCGVYGYRYGIVFASNRACYHRLGIKAWASKKLGPPAFLNYAGSWDHQVPELKNTDSVWFAGFLDYGRRDRDPYYIVFKKKIHRDFAIYL